MRASDPIAPTLRPVTVSDSHVGGVSWAAVIAGATAAAALTLILLMLGVGLGLSLVSPWSGAGMSSGSFGVSTILWLVFTQVVASGAGGYLAGRLRRKWLDTHTDEVYFRDTAHGFLAWAVASLVTAALLSGTVSAIVGGGARTTAALAGGAASTGVAAMASHSGPGNAGSNSGSGADTMDMGYSIDSLFRAAPQSAAPDAMASSASAESAEVTRIYARDLAAGQMSSDDQNYVAQIVAQRTGLAQTEANQRVSDLFAREMQYKNAVEQRARAAADAARKAGAYASIWIFISLLCGAFVASLMATHGGKVRDGLR
jgi:hypothetical protein